jgi:sugar lactone lactonase YvrE
MLLAHYPHNGSTHALMTGLWYGNGLVLSHDESYVLVGESLQARIHR